jgi:hypothetical protein
MNALQVWVAVAVFCLAFWLAVAVAAVEVM